MKNDKKNQENIEISNFENSELLQIAKAKLRWYTLEASEEEFDEAAVDALVNLVEALEKRLEGQVEQNNRAEESQLEQFYAYCNLRAQDKQSLDAESISCENGHFENKKMQKRIPFRSKRMAAMAAAACILLIVAVFSTFGVANAGEGNGFFHWLRKDGRGQVIVTDPSRWDVEEYNAKEYIYEDLINVPDEYHKYMLEKEKIELLNDFRFSHLKVYDSATCRRISEVFINESTDKFIVVGISDYRDQIVIAGEQFDEYELQTSDTIGKQRRDIFLKVNEKNEKEYIFLVYHGSYKYYVCGNEEFSILEKISREHLNMVVAKIEK